MFWISSRLIPSPRLHFVSNLIICYGNVDLNMVEFEIVVFYENCVESVELAALENPAHFFITRYRDFIWHTFYAWKSLGSLAICSDNGRSSVLCSKPGI